MADTHSFSFLSDCIFSIFSHTTSTVQCTGTVEMVQAPVHPDSSQLDLEVVTHTESIVGLSPGSGFERVT